MVERLIADGTPVVACDRREEDLPRWLDALDSAHRGRVIFHPLDVTREEQVVALARALAGEGIEIPYLVNNAGIQVPGRLDAFETRRWDLVMDVNLRGTFHLMRAFSGPMVERGFGRIVNLASVYAYHPGRGQPAYAAAKAAITGLTRSSALDLARKGVTVNAIAPGLIDHPRLREAIPPDDFQALLAQVPAGREGRPEEIAATVVFLLSDEAGYITGQTLHVNGGLYLPG